MSAKIGELKADITLTGADDFVAKMKLLEQSLNKAAAAANKFQKALGKISTKSVKSKKELVKGLQESGEGFKKANKQGLILRGTLGGNITAAYLLRGAMMGAAGVSLWALGKMTTKAGEYGMEMSMLSKRTGISVTAFQKLAYAGAKFGVDMDETLGTISNLQKQMDEFAISGKGPQWLIELAGVTSFDLDKTKDTLYVIGKLQEYALKKLSDNKAADLLHKRTTLGSFGFSDKFISMLLSGGLTQKNMKGALTVSDKETNDLAKTKGAWKQILVNLDTLAVKWAAVLLNPGAIKVLELLNTVLDRFYQLAVALDDSKTEMGEFWDSFARNPFREKTEAEDKLNMKLAAKQYAGRAKSGEKLSDADLARMAIYYRPKTQVLDEPASPVINRRSAKGIDKNYSVVVNQTNEFKNDDSTPAQVSKASERGVRKGMSAVQRQVDSAGMQTGYQSAGN